MYQNVLILQEEKNNMISWHSEIILNFVESQIFTGVWECNYAIFFMNTGKNKNQV